MSYNKGLLKKLRDSYNYKKKQGLLNNSELYKNMKWTDRLFYLLLSEEDLTSKKARKAATKAAVHMDTTHEKNVEREMAKQHIRTGKDGDRRTATNAAIENDPQAPASAKRAVKAKKTLSRMFRKAKRTPAKYAKYGRDATVPDYEKAQKQGMSFIKKNNPKSVDKLKTLTKAATGNPLDKANRTVQRVIDRESRATRVGYGPKETASTANMLSKARNARSRRGK